MGRRSKCGPNPHEGTKYGLATTKKYCAVVSAISNPSIPNTRLSKWLFPGGRNNQFKRELSAGSFDLGARLLPAEVAVEVEVADLRVVTVSFTVSLRGRKQQGRFRFGIRNRSIVY